MRSGRPSTELWLLVIPLAALVLLCGLSALVIRSRNGFTIPQSVGMATAVPGQVLAKPQSLPAAAAAAPSVLTPVAPVATAMLPIIPPTPLPLPLASISPANTTTKLGTGTAEAQPYPASGADSGSGQPQASTGPAEPYPAGSDPGTGNASTARTSCNRRIVHIVRSGENLFRIALRYNTTATAIARLNGITNVRSLRVGQRLVVITCSAGNVASINSTYVVQAGDNLFRIALRFGTTIAAIRAVNGLDSDLVSNGQVLRIPN